MKQAPLLVAVFILLVSLASCGSGGDDSAVASPGAGKGSEDESATSDSKDASSGADQASKGERVTSHSTSSKVTSSKPKADPKAQKSSGAEQVSKGEQATSETKTPLDAESYYFYNESTSAEFEDEEQQPKAAETTTPLNALSPSIYQEITTPLNASSPESSMPEVDPEAPSP